MRFLRRLSSVQIHALSRRQEIRAELQRKCPTLTQRRQPAPPLDRSAIVLGRNGGGSPFLLPLRPRLEHTLAIGTTGGGKSTFLEHCIRQDIAAGRGVLVVDPHGEHPDSLYRSVLSWMKARGYMERRRVHIIDPNDCSHTVGFNPLARADADTELSVISGVTLEAFSRAWGGEDMSRKPTIERVLTTTFSALAELGLSLVEAHLLLDRHDSHGLRRHAIATVQDRYTRLELQRLDELSHDERRRADFDMEVLGPINRLARFLRPAATASMVGQTVAGLDFVEAFDNGHVILCNLSGSNRIYEADADLLGRLVTRFAFFHAKRRRHPERPFFMYMDECHRYLSGDLENILAESRKYGLGAILATQWLQQLRKESENMLAAVLNATNIKVVFRAKDPEEAEQLAEMVMPFDLEIPVGALIKPTVTGYRRIRLANESTSDQRSTTHSQSETRGETRGRTATIGGSTSTTETESTGELESNTVGHGTGTSRGRTAGSGVGSSNNEDLDINSGVFGPQAIGASRGWSSSNSDSASSGSSTNANRSRASGRSLGFSRAISENESWSVSVSRSTQHSTTAGLSETQGESRSRGNSEALEAVLTNLPSAVHSRDNVRYMAGLLVRGLPTGRAVVNYVGPNGMVSSLLKVPLVSEQRLSPDAFCRLRQEALSRSASALPAARAAELVAEREQMILAATKPAEVAEPETFRTKAPPLAPEQDRSRPAAAGRGRTRRSTKPSEAAE